MTKPECQIAGYKLLGDYTFTELIPDLITDGRWDMVSTSVKEARSALQFSKEEGFISGEQLQTLKADLNILESAAEGKDEKSGLRAFGDFFRTYGTVIIDAIAECECKVPKEPVVGEAVKCPYCGTVFAPRALPGQMEVCPKCGAKLLV